MLKWAGLVVMKLRKMHLAHDLDDLSKMIIVVTFLSDHVPGGVLVLKIGSALNKSQFSSFVLSDMQNHSLFG